MSEEYKSLSRQRLWQIRMVEEGRCPQCGSEREFKEMVHCVACAKDRRKAARKRANCGTNPRAWTENKKAFYAELLALDWNELGGTSGLAKKYKVSPSTVLFWANRLGIRKMWVKPQENIVSATQTK